MILIMRCSEKSGIAGEPVKADVAYATNLVDGVQKHIDKIDETFRRRRSGGLWNECQRSIFQSCAMQHMRSFSTETIPKAVAINEAVELAKIYCDEGSPRFINGCLGRIANSAAK